LKDSPFTSIKNILLSRYLIFGKGVCIKGKSQSERASFSQSRLDVHFSFVQFRYSLHKGKSQPISASASSCVRTPKEVSALLNSVFIHPLAGIPNTQIGFLLFYITPCFHTDSSAFRSVFAGIVQEVCNNSCKKFNAPENWGKREFFLFEQQGWKQMPMTCMMIWWLF
jgi:hypothetical protein